MRAGWFLITGFVLLGAVSPLWADPFAEVPSGHWAYDVCARLITVGILPSDNSVGFSGDPSLTRFEFGIALLDPLTGIDYALADTRERETQLRSVLRQLEISPRSSESDIAAQLSDIRRLAIEFQDVFESMGFDVARVVRTLGALNDEAAIRAWRLESLDAPVRGNSFRSDSSKSTSGSDTIHLPVGRGTVGVSLTSLEEPPELLDYLAISSAADRSGEYSAPASADAALTDPRVSRLRTTYEYGVGSALTLSLAYEEIDRRGQCLEALDAASLTSLGIGYKLTPSTSVQLSYSLLEYSNYALDTPPVRDRVAETALSIEF